MDQFQALLEAFAALGFGWQGLVIIALILGGVYIARKAGLAATGDQARIANLLLGAVLAGLSDNPQSESALLAVLSSTLSALAYEGIKALGDRNTKPNAEI